MANEKGAFRIMTSNIWGDYFGNPPTKREDQLFAVYKRYDPDVIGFQEVTRAWHLSTLFPALAEDYTLIGAGDAAGANYVPMAIKNDFSVIEQGYERLENTPDVSKAITWAVIERDGKTLGVCNTHFWWMKGNEDVVLRRNCGVEELTLDGHNELRADNARQMARIMNAIAKKYSCPVFGFGDMNSTIEEKVFEVYDKNGIERLFEIAEEKDTVCSIHGDPKRGEDGWYHGQRETDEYLTWFRGRLQLNDVTVRPGYKTSIDHIVGLGSASVKQYRIIEDQEALDATDHSPVYADILI